MAEDVTAIPTSAASQLKGKTVNETRIEEDLLGSKEVPIGAYYGIHTVRALENFKISSAKISDVPEMVRGMVIAGCDAVLNDARCMDQFPIDVFQGGAGTSVNMNTNEVIANLALEHMGLAKGRYDVVNPNEHVNESQSTNDAFPSGFRIALFTVVEELKAEVENLAVAFDAKADEFKDVLKMGRTQLQDAIPMTLGQEFKVYGLLMREEVRQLSRAAELLLEVNLGATAIGTGLNTPEGYAAHAVSKLAEVSGLPVVLAENLIEATSDAGAYVSMHGAVKRVAVKLGKVCNDLRLLSSGPRTGLNEINLPGLQAGSSIMPAKVNPVLPEVVNQVCFKVIGNDVTVSMAAEAGQLQLNVMEPVIAQSLFESVSLLTNACQNLRVRCVDGITANPEVCLGYVMNSIGIVTFLNPIIGHHAGDLVGKECARTGKTVPEVVLEMGLLNQDELDKIFSPENLIRPEFRGKVFASKNSVDAPLKGVTA